MTDGPLTGAPLNFPTVISGAPHRPMFPVYDQSGDAPFLAYQLNEDGAPDQAFTIRGFNLSDLDVLAFLDVSILGNSGDPPSVGFVSANETSVSMEVDPTGTSAGDVWAIILDDADGNIYIPPSPLNVYP